MTYIALYRQWRPQRFNEMVGQQHISVTLKNAINQERIGHAYLFTGPRGTGKTSAAKIFAKAINCQNPKEGEPCNQCECCVPITKGSSMDVLEIDAASNRGIDEIRDLREKVKYAPTESRYKVYIIDEVHMLTTEAFNALLKTLEEPPKHVVFILATTEPHKIPLTILSRCQRFDFRRIGQKEIVSRLDEIIKSEHLSVTPRALQLIAKKAEGGMRDALSLLDQCLSFVGQEVSEDTVTQILGTVDAELISRVVQVIADKDPVQLLSIIDGIAQEGKDLKQFLQDLLEYFRNLILLRLSQDTKGLSDVPDFLYPALTAQGTMFTMNELFAMMETLSEAETQVKFSNQPRITLEVFLMKLTGLKKKETITLEQQMPHKIEQVKEDISSGAHGISFTTVKEHWKQVLDQVKKRSPSTYAYLREGEPVELINGTIRVIYKPNFVIHMENIEKPTHLKVIEEAVQLTYRQSLKVQGFLAQTVENNQQVVKQVQDFFGASIVEIKD